MNWLANIPGKAGHFKELDLLQEHENYYIKVCTSLLFRQYLLTNLMYFIGNLPSQGGEQE